MVQFPQRVLAPVLCGGEVELLFNVLLRELLLGLYVLSSCLLQEDQKHNFSGMEPQSTLKGVSGNQKSRKGSLFFKSFSVTQRPLTAGFCNERRKGVLKGFKGLWLTGLKESQLRVS